MLGKPVVSIKPMTKILNEGRTVTIECIVISDPSKLREIKWYKNGYSISGNGGRRLKLIF